MLPGRAFCVGEQTARIATKAGFEALSADSNAAGLVEMVKAQRPTGPLIHLRGQYSHGAVAESLISAGIETYEAVIYRQTAQPLNSEALAVLGKTEPVFVPLFSPRSAKLFADELLALIPRAPLYIAALSAAVAQEVLTLPVASLEIAPTSDSSGMVKALGALFATAPGP